MQNETDQLPMFFVAGLAVRTLNKDGQAGKDIGRLWQSLMQPGVADKLNEKEGNEVYCVYTDYESDYTGYYTAILGYKVSSIEYLPEGFTGKAIAASKYEVFTADGEFPTNIGATWQHIWQTDLNRTYTADFDVYELKEKFEDTEFKIYVAID